MEVETHLPWMYEVDMASSISAMMSKPSSAISDDLRDEWCSNSTSSMGNMYFVNSLICSLLLIVNDFHLWLTLSLCWSKLDICCFVHWSILFTLIPNSGRRSVLLLFSLRNFSASCFDFFVTSFLLFMIWFKYFIRCLVNLISSCKYLILDEGLS